MKEKKLTVKQQRFVDCYDGNGVEAARKAGYKGNDNTLRSIASENLTKPDILNAIKEREDKHNKSAIANREDRQIYWTDTMRDEDKQPRDRLRASELLGRSEADFKENSK